MFPSVLFALLLALLPQSAFATPKVVASIPPLYSFAASLMGGVDAPVLLVSGTVSPHEYQMTPSARLLLEEETLVFYIDPKLETFLTGALKTAPAKAVPLASHTDIKLLPLRGGGVWETEEHRHSHAHAQEHEHTGRDYHLWLNPLYALEMAKLMEKELSIAYPQHAGAFAKNLAQLEQELKQLDGELEAVFHEVRDVPFLISHDALHYLEDRYHLTAAGALTLEPHMPPTAAQLAELKRKVDAQGARCIFLEAGFPERVINTITEDTKTRTATLDFIGTGSPAGKENYRTMMRQLATTMHECLATRSP